MALVTKAVASSAVAYGLPKLMSYLCARPDPLSQAKLDRLRNRLAFLQEVTREVLGQKTWFVLTEVVADNAWLSLLVLNYLASGVEGSLNAEQISAMVTGFVAFGGLSWMSRYGLTKVYPPLGKFIGTRSLN